MDYEQRRARKSASPNTQLGMEHTRQCVVLPDRVALLDMLPAGGVAAEVGVAFGEFTELILKHSNPRQLYLIDSWESDRYQKGLLAIREKYQTEIDAHVIHIRQGRSTIELAAAENSFFDWIYIDTDHTYPTTRDELLLCEQKVKSDGLILGHDFCTGNAVDAIPYGVVEAVNQFCVTRDWKFKYFTLESHGHFSFCLGRIL